MGLIDNTREWLRVQLRAFVLGPGVVDPWDAVWGRDSDTYQPKEYGEYLATSNGVYACSTLRAELLSSLPLKVQRVKEGGNVVDVDRGPLVELLQKVNPFWTQNRLMQMTELSLCLWGEAFWFLERGESGAIPPREIWWGRPDRVRVVAHPEDYISGFVYQPATSMDALVFEPGEVIWFRLPNPLDEYRGLSPLAAARLAADVSGAAMKSNYNLFEQGMQLGGVIQPEKDRIWSEEQAANIADLVNRRFRGVDKAHRWAIFRNRVEFQEAGISPRDAEFLGALKWSLEDICRAYKVPLDLLGGQRSYENLDAALKAVWAHAIIPEGRFIATELVEQLLPMFPGQADLAAFDSSGVEVLQEAEGERWGRAKEQIEKGAITINEWRDGQGLEDVDWGDVWWASRTLMPVEDGEVELAVLPMLPAVEEEAPPQSPPSDGGEERGGRRQVEYGSQEHVIAWQRFARRTEQQERVLGQAVARLMQRLRDSVMDRLKSGERSMEEAVMAPFDREQWDRTFEKEIKPVLEQIVSDNGNAVLGDLGLTLAFDVFDPIVLEFLDQRAQRFAVRVNETTWRELKDGLMEGIEAGESIPELADRVEDVMQDRIRSSKTTIARTEVIGAANGGTLQAWQQSDVVGGKSWLSALDQRTRDSHIDAHGQTVDLNADFYVGACVGPAPGQMGCAEEDINCRCAMTAVVK